MQNLDGTIRFHLKRIHTSFMAKPGYINILATIVYLQYDVIMLTLLALLLFLFMYLLYMYLFNLYLYLSIYLGIWSYLLFYYYYVVL